jgi:hypothetical protein
LFSGISAGTELTAYRGTNPYLHKRWDGNRRLFVGDERVGAEYPLTGWGYEEVGEIVEIGTDVTDLQVGQRVYGIWGHRTSHVVPAEYARAPSTLTQAGGQDVIIGIRAENIEASAQPAADALPARTEVVEPVGSHLLITALVGDQRLKLLTRTDFPAASDAPLWIRPNLTSCAGSMQRPGRRSRTRRARRADHQYICVRTRRGNSIDHSS